MRAVIFALVLTAIVSAAIGLPLVARLRRLRHAIGDLGSGNLAVRVDPNEGELSDLAKSINGMASRLERQFQEREALLQAVSHEMGTPLSRMRFTIEMLDDESRTQVHPKRLLTADLEELDRLSSELVDWIEPDGAGPRKQEFRVAPVIESLVAIETPRSGTPVCITVGVRPELTIMADQRQFQRAIENLLRNAVRYAQQHIIVNGIADGERVIVEVRDDGPGIARDQWARVLDPFVTFEGGRSGARRRLGLGLAIVRRIVEAHGGSVVIAEAPEGGTRVTTCWPRVAVWPRQSIVA
jgi:signal transduction histidine kinase